MTIVSYYFWDIPLTKYCQTLSRSVTNMAEIITLFGITQWYIVASIGFFLFFRFIYKNDLHAARSLFVFLSLGISGIVITFVKWIAGRHRPVNFFQHGFFGFDFFGVGYELTSFPSGHAQTVFALATAITIIFPRWGIPAFIFAIVVSISRIILTAHYLSDVIAGAGVAILCTMAIKCIFDWKKITLSPRMKE
jgi:membrane-associated phospholipid phosphatase